MSFMELLLYRCCKHIATAIGAHAMASFVMDLWPAWWLLRQRTATAILPLQLSISTGRGVDSWQHSHGSARGAGDLRILGFRVSASAVREPWGLAGASESFGFWSIEGISLVARKHSFRLFLCVRSRRSLWRQGSTMRICSLIP